MDRRQGLFADAFENRMNTKERAFLTICQRIYRDNKGGYTPAESLVEALILHVGYFPQLSSADVEEYVEAFEDNLKGDAPLAGVAYREDFVYN